jgi:hypothetical protein
VVHIFLCNMQYVKESAADKTEFSKVSGVVQRTMTNIDGERCLFVQHNRDVSRCKVVKFIDIKTILPRS